jgi:hypothetical protein
MMLVKFGKTERLPPSPASSSMLSPQALIHTTFARLFCMTRSYRIESMRLTFHIP